MSPLLANLTAPGPRPAAPDADGEALDPLDPAEVSAMLLAAAEQGEPTYRQARGWPEIFPPPAGVLCLLRALDRWLAARDQRRAPQLLADRIDQTMPDDLPGRISRLETEMALIRADVEAVTS